MNTISVKQRDNTSVIAQDNTEITHTIKFEDTWSHHYTFNRTEDIRSAGNT